MQLMRCVIVRAGLETTRRTSWAWAWLAADADADERQQTGRRKRDRHEEGDGDRSYPSIRDQVAGNNVARMTV